MNSAGKIVHPNVRPVGDLGKGINRKDGGKGKQEQQLLVAES